MTGSQTRLTTQGRRRKLTLMTPGRSARPRFGASEPPQDSRILCRNNHEQKEDHHLYHHTLNSHPLEQENLYRCNVDDDELISSCSATSVFECDSRSPFEEVEEHCNAKTQINRREPSKDIYKNCDFVPAITTTVPSSQQTRLLSMKFRRSMARIIATPCILFIMLGLLLRYHKTDAVGMSERSEGIQFFDVDFKHVRKTAGEIRRAHSHNDYHQKEPLMAALRHGFASVEVDVFPRGDVLLVGHTRLELNEKNTIDEMYIKPILNIIRREKRKTVEFISNKTTDVQDTARRTASHRSRRRVNLPFDTDEGLTLLVDLKADPTSSIDLLHQALEPLRPHLTYAKKDGQIRKGKVTVLISGNRPSEESLVNAEGERYMFIDGRARDVERNTDSALVPMVSIPWRSMQLARMFGRGERYMKNMVEQAHDQGKLLRIWGAPNNERNWRKMLKSNVDYLSIDDHAKFATFASRVHRI